MNGRAEPSTLFVLGSLVVACSAKVARLPRPGESLLAEAFTIELGGKGFNLAFGARRLGAEVGGLLPVGDDPFSHFAEAALAATGLPATMLRRLTSTTGSGIGFTDSTGENCLAVYPGANSLLSAPDVRSASEALESAALVLAHFEIGDEPILEAFSLARKRGARTLLNPSPFRTVDARVLEQTCILVLNEVEAIQLVGEDAAAGPGQPRGHFEARLQSFAAQLFERGPDTIIVTLGERGAVALCRDEAPLHQPAFKVDAMDTLGAGDAFTAGLAVSLLEGQPLSKALNRAAACGAMMVQKLGVFHALPTRQELKAFLSQRARPSDIGLFLDLAKKLNLSQTPCYSA